MQGAVAHFQMETERLAAVVVAAPGRAVVQSHGDTRGRLQHWSRHLEAGQMLDEVAFRNG